MREVGVAETAMERPDLAEPLVRWMAGVAVVLTLAAPLTSLSLASEFEPLAPVLLGTLLYLPILGWLVWNAARGKRPARAGWLLAAMAVVVVGGLPLNGVPWLPVFGDLALVVLIVVPPPWSLIIFGGLVAAQFPLAAAVGDPTYGLLGALLASKALAMFALLWLMAAARQLSATRARLASEAVMQERLRLDDELRRTVGADLEAIVDRARELASATDEAQVEAGLGAIAGQSRSALARVRGMVGAFQRRSLRSVLDTAASLLRAAGVETLVVAPDELPDGADDVRDRLRGEVAALLRDDSTTSCSITVTVSGERVDLDVRSGAATAPVEVGS